MLFFNIFNTSNDKYPPPSNMLNLKKLFPQCMYFSFVSLSYLTSVFHLLSSLFRGSVWSDCQGRGLMGLGCGLMGDGRGWWWRWFYGRRLWSDGHESWVRRSNDRGGGSAWVVGHRSTGPMGFASCGFWFTDLLVMVKEVFFFFGLWSWFWFSMSCGSPIYWVCMCDGFWFTDLVWWVLVRRALLVGSDRGCWGGGFWLLFVPWFLFFYFGGWGLRLWLVVVVVAVAVGGGGSGC